MKTNKIVIVGGGSAGWMTAATLIKAFPNKSITVIESKDIAIVGVGESTLGGIKRWTRYIGLDESSFFPYTDASLKLSIKFTDFYKKDYGYFHYPFGKPMKSPGRNPFFDWHLKKYYYPGTNTQDFVNTLFPASALFENNRFSKNTEGLFGNFSPDNDVAYHFDATKFGAWLRDQYCIPKGVAHIADTVISVNSENGWIKTLELTNGDLVEADLFVDCTGFTSLLLSQTVKQPFISYEEMLPNNRALAIQLPYKDKEKELEGFTNSTAIGNGWCWNIPLWSRLGTGYVYSDKYITKEEAIEEFKEYLKSDKMVVPRTDEDLKDLTFKDIRMRVGIHANTFVNNVVAIGLSAGFIEPLESNGLFSVHEFLFRLIDILQRGDINQFDRDVYNVAVRNLFDGFAKFVAMHYALSHRDDTEYWRAIQRRNFSGLDGDPYSFYVSKTDNFHGFGHNYLDKWEFPDPDISNGGITYIATGMNIQMMNFSRIQHIEFMGNRNLQQEAKEISEQLSARRCTWLTAANDCPTLYQYLKNTYYDKNEI